MATYEEELLRGFAHAVAGHGVTAVRHLGARTIGETAAAPEHRVVALARVMGERVESNAFVITSGLGQKPLGAVAAGSLSRFELMAWVDDPDIPALHPPDVLLLLSILGRIIHGNAKPGTPAWHLGHTVTLPDEGLAGWNRFLLARSVAPIQTSSGSIDIVRVLPISDEEEQRRRDNLDVMGGWSFVTECENLDLPATLARFRDPPGGPAAVTHATRLVFEPNGDTLRIYPASAPWDTDVMRDVVLGLDAAGFLTAVEIIDRQGPRVLVELGPREQMVRHDYARVLQTKSGELLLTMAAKRVRGHVPHPYVPWEQYGAGG